MLHPSLPLAKFMDTWINRSLRSKGRGGATWWPFCRECVGQSGFIDEGVKTEANSCGFSRRSKTTARKRRMQRMKTQTFLCLYRTIPLLREWTTIRICSIRLHNLNLAFFPFFGPGLWCGCARAFGRLPLIYLQMISAMWWGTII